MDDSRYSITVQWIGVRGKDAGIKLGIGYLLIYVSPPPSFQGTCLVPQFPPLEE